MDKQPSYSGGAIEVVKGAIPSERKLPEWVKCYKCGKPPMGSNWLKPVSNDHRCRQLIHLDCIQAGLSKLFERMGERV